jgi:hypothetical protein
MSAAVAGGIIAFYQVARQPLEPAEAPVSTSV